MDFLPYYSIIFIAAASIFFGLYRNNFIDNDQYFIGNRNAHWIAVAFSVAATWFYANVPFFIIKWQPVYGLWGGFWVTLGIVVPMFGIGLLGWYISKKKNFRKFFNLQDLIIEKTKNKNVLLLFIFIYLLAAVYNTTANLTAFGFITEYFSAVNYSVLTGVFLAMIIFYTILGGFKAVVRTDVLQMILIMLGGLVVGWIVASDMASVKDVLLHDIGSFLNSNLLNIFLTIALIITGSALTDNGMFQRVFAQKNGKNILKSFALASVLYMIGCFGLILVYAGWQYSGIESSKPIFSVIDTISANGNTILIFFFVTAFLSMSASNIDSVMHSVGSMLAKYFGTKKNQKRLSSIILFVFAVSIYVITQLKIDLWLLLTTFGTIRLTVVFPTLYIIFYKNINSIAVVVSILVSLVLGLYLQTTELDKLYTILVTLITPLIIIKSFELKSKLVYNKE